MSKTCNIKNTYVKFVLIVKDNRFVRKIMRPFVQAAREKRVNDYAKSEDSKRIRELHEKFLGETCYIIGNGPSLRIADLERLCDQYTFAANKIYTLFDKTKWRPTFYTCTDLESFKLFGDKLGTMDAEYLFYDIPAKKYLRNIKNPHIHYICMYTPFPKNKWDSVHPFVSEDASKMLSIGMTVTFASIQLAIYMGFKKIYLLGVDHSYAKQVTKDGKVIINNDCKDYGEGIEDTGLGCQYVDATTEAYEQARKYCDLHGIEIYNATRGGKLEVFERADFDSLWE